MPFASIEEFKEAVKGLSNAADVEDYLNQAVEAERQSKLGKQRKTNEEAQLFKRYKVALEAAGYDGLAEDLDDWIAGLKKPADKGAADPEIDKLRKEFAKAQKALEEEKANVQKIKSSADRKTVRSKLVEALRDKVYGPDLLADSLISEGKVKLGDDESVLFVNGEDETEFGAGVKKLLETRPDLVRNTQAPGAKSGTRSQAAAPRYSLDQLKSMSANEIANDMQNVLASIGTQK